MFANPSRPIRATALFGAASLLALFAPVALSQDSSSAPGTVFRDCPACPEMVVVPPGQFTMGSTREESGHMDEKPQRTVKIGKAFAVAKYEATFDLLDACAADGKCAKADDDGFGRKGIPAINVNWAEAQALAAWLSAKTGKRYRLLTEAEWEYAARAGTSTPWFWGAPEDSYGSTKACEFANTHDEASKEAHPMYVWSHHKCADGVAEVGPVGKYKPNPFGLHDILGNVREWVQDCHQAGYANAPSDGSAFDAAECEKRIVRGGGWVDGASTTRAAYRHPENPGYRNAQVGIRLARDL